MKQAATELVRWGLGATIAAQLPLAVACSQASSPSEAAPRATAPRESVEPDAGTREQQKPSAVARPADAGRVADSDKVDGGDGSLGGVTMTPQLDAGCGQSCGKEHLDASAPPEFGCAVDNGGCGDSTYTQCIEERGQSPNCVDVEECSSGSGGCELGEVCFEQLGGAPLCQVIAPEVSVGYETTCKLDSEGHATCWGRSSDFFEAVHGEDKFTNLYAPGRGDDVCGLQADGRLRCALGFSHLDGIDSPRFQSISRDHWGQKGLCGILLDGSLLCSTSAGPAAAIVPDGSGLPFLQVATSQHSCALRSDGRIFCWGSDEQVAHVAGPNASASSDFVQVVVGYAYPGGGSRTCALHATGRIECWGEPEWIAGPNASANSNYVQLEAVSSRFCALDTEGTLECWGTNSSATGSVTTARDSRFVQIGLARRHRCSMRADGEVECRGDDDFGQVSGPQGWTRCSGVGTCPLNEVCVPTSETEYSCLARSLSAGFGTTCSIRSGQLSCWGFDVDEQVSGANASPFANYQTVAVGSNHTCAIREGGVVECWGSDPFGAVSGPNGLETGGFLTVDVGSSNTCLFAPGDSPSCWGLDLDNQVTDANSTRALSLVVGNDHICGLDSSSARPLCWGNNTSGQVSGENLDTRLDNTNFAAGARHTCVRNADSTVQCWGDDSAGQVSGPNSSPSQDFVFVAAGGNTTCALHFGGTAECWGDDSYGQSTLASSVSRQDFGLLTVGETHVCGLRLDGSIECWGDDLVGQVSGPNSEPPLPSP